jgi:cbb3-type cytochrome oxidase maturation protein
MFLLCIKFHNFMKIILFLIIISITVAICFLAAFFWAVRDGQFDDEYTPSVRILLDDDMIDSSKNNS